MAFNGIFLKFISIDKSSSFSASRYHEKEPEKTTRFVWKDKYTPFRFEKDFSTSSIFPTFGNLSTEIIWVLTISLFAILFV